MLVFINHFCLLSTYKIHASLFIRVLVPVIKDVGYGELIERVRVMIRKKLFTDSVSVNKKYLTDSVSVNKKYLTDSGFPIEKNHVKGGGLLYGGFYIYGGMNQD